MMLDQNISYFNKYILVKMELSSFGAAFGSGKALTYNAMLSKSSVVEINLFMSKPSNSFLLL